jgi:Avidin family
MSMNWLGTWRNQYGSTLRIADASGGRIVGSFRTALDDSSFYGLDCSIAGLCQGNCITFAFAGSSANGDVISSFTGLLRGGRIETVWHVVNDGRAAGGGIVERPWPHAVMTNADTFERVAEYTPAR